MKNNIKTYGPWVISLLFIIAAFGPVLLRAGSDAPLIPGSSSYEQLRMANLIIEGTPGYDTLYDRPVVQSPFTFLLSLFLLFGGAWLLPIILSAVLLFLFYRCCLRVSSTAYAILALAVFIVSPTFSIFSSNLEPLLFSMICVLGAWLLFGRSSVLAGLLLFLSIITVPIFGFIITAALLIRFASSRSSSTFSVLAALIAGLLLVRPSSFVLFEPNLLFELGHPAGMSVFFVIFAIFGLFSDEMGKREIVGLVGLGILTVLFPVLLPLLVMAAALVISYGIVMLATEKWELELLRQSLLVLVMCVGLLLLILAMRERAEAQPTADFMGATAYLQKGYRPGSILTDPSYAPMISYMSGRHVQKGPLPEDILLSRDAEQVYEYLESTGTSHIMITDQMSNDVFDRSDEGILFLLPNTRRFVTVHQSETVEIWYYIPR